MKQDVSVYSPVDIGRTMLDIDRFMDTFFGASPFTRRGTGIARDLRVPAVDIRETDKAYVIEAELPGYDEKNIEVNMDGGVLTIEGKTATGKDEENKDKHYLMKERGEASFTRSFRLPENADAEKITASFKNGLLCLEIQKRTEAQKKVIPIEATK
jgi:HSP20 family molecular chaperone IbpA